MDFDLSSEEQFNEASQKFPFLENLVPQLLDYKTLGKERLFIGEHAMEVTDRDTLPMRFALDPPLCTSLELQLFSCSGTEATLHTKEFADFSPRALVLGRMEQEKGSPEQVALLQEFKEGRGDYYARFFESERRFEEMILHEPSSNRAQAMVLQKAARFGGIIMAEGYDAKVKSLCVGYHNLASADARLVQFQLLHLPLSENKVRITRQILVFTLPETQAAWAKQIARQLG